MAEFCPPSIILMLLAFLVRILDGCRGERGAEGFADEPPVYSGMRLGEPERSQAIRCIGRLDMKVRIGCHTFRATGIAADLEAGGTLENSRAMAAAHASPHDKALRSNWR